METKKKLDTLTMVEMALLLAITIIMGTTPHCWTDWRNCLRSGIWIYQPLQCIDRRQRYDECTDERKPVFCGIYDFSTQIFRGTVYSISF